MVLQPLPVGKDLSEKILAVSEVVGLATNFEDVWRAHVAPDSLTSRRQWGAGGPHAEAP